MGIFILVTLLVGVISGQLIQLRAGGLDIPLIDLTLLISLVVGWFYAKQHQAKTRNIIKLPVVRAAAYFAGAILLSVLVAIPSLWPSVSSILITGLYAGRLIGYLLLLPILILVITQTPKPLVHGLIGWFGFGLVLTGLTQLAIFPDFRIFDHFGWDPHRDRLLGSFLDPNYMAIWLSGFLLFIICVYGATKQWLFKTLLSFVVIITIFYTLSRSGLLALVAGVASVVAIRLKWWSVIFVGLALIAAVFVPGISQRLAGVVELDTTVRYRLESWEGAVSVIRQNPITGVGYNSLKFTRYQSTPPGTSKLISRFEDGIIRPQQLSSRADSGFDSSLLTIFATTGLVGIIAFCWWVWLVLLNSYSYIRKHGLFTSSAWVFGFTVSLLVSSWFVNAWLYPAILILWMIAVASATLEWNYE